MWGSSLTLVRGILCKYQRAPSLLIWKERLTFQAVCQRFSECTWSHVFRMSTVCVSLVFWHASLVRWLSASGLQRCPEPEQDTESLGIPSPFLTKKSDGLFLLIDFPLQSSRVSGLIGSRVEEKWPLGSFQGTAWLDPKQLKQMSLG